MHLYLQESNASGADSDIEGVTSESQVTEGDKPALPATPQSIFKSCVTQHRAIKKRKRSSATSKKTTSEQNKCKATTGDESDNEDMIPGHKGRKDDSPVGK